MIRLQVRLIIAVAFVALLALSTGTALAAPSMQTDMPPGVTVSAPVAATLAEGGTTTYTVVLDALPTEEVTVTIAVLDKAENPDSTNINLHTGTGTPAANLNLTFTTTNWNMAQTVTITAVNDTVAEADLDYIITHTVTGSGHTDFRADDVDITVSANDPLTITIGATMPRLMLRRWQKAGASPLSVVLSIAPADRRRYRDYHVQHYGRHKIPQWHSDLFVYEPTTRLRWSRSRIRITIPVCPMPRGSRSRQPEAEQPQYFNRLC